MSGAIGGCDGVIAGHSALDQHGLDGGTDAGLRRDAGGIHEPDARVATDASHEPPDAEIAPVDAGPGRYRLEDSLRGGTAGNPIGGSFGPDGWTTTDRTDRIWYALPRLVEGSIEFTIANVFNDTLLPGDTEIMTMYEDGWGIGEPIAYMPQYRNNHYKAMVRIYGRTEEGRSGQQKLIWLMCPSGAPGYDDCGCASFIGEPFGGDGTWDGTPQRIRVEWAGSTARYLRNGNEVLTIDWSESGLTFGPQELHFSLGSSRSTAVDETGMPLGAVLSDLVIEGAEGDAAVCP